MNAKAASKETEQELWKKRMTVIRSGFAGKGQCFRFVQQMGGDGSKGKYTDKDRQSRKEVVQPGVDFESLLKKQERLCIEGNKFDIDLRGTIMIKIMWQSAGRPSGT